MRPLEGSLAFGEPLADDAGGHPETQDSADAKVIGEIAMLVEGKDELADKQRRCESYQMSCEDRFAAKPAAESSAERRPVGQRRLVAQKAIEVIGEFGCGEIAISR